MESIRRCIQNLCNKGKDKELSRCYICLDEKKLKKLSCNHHVHKDCLQSQVNHLVEKGSVLLPRHGQCGLCGKWIQKKDVSSKYHQSIIYELKAACNNLEEERLSQQRFFRCYYCKALFKGQKVPCAEDENDIPDPATVRCYHCRDKCAIHEEEYLNYKCRYCCNVASYFCGYGNHMCPSCHDIQMVRDCVGESGGCDGNHPPNGTTSFCLGCTMCKIDRKLSIDGKSTLSKHGKYNTI